MPSGGGFEHLGFDPGGFFTASSSGLVVSLKVSDLITATLKLIGAIAKSEVPSADELNDGFARLNDMLDTWAADRLMIFQVVRSVYSLTSGRQSYTIGKDGTPDFNAVRPTWIQDAGIISTAVSPTFELPVALLTDDDWSRVTLKSTQAALSWYLYYDYAFPNGNIYLWPVPSVSTLQLALYVPTPVSQFSDVTAVVSLPPGYAEALRYNLAVRLCPEFGVQVDPVVGTLAMQSKHMVELANNRMETLGMDPSLVGAGGRGAWNWILGVGGGYR